MTPAPDMFDVALLYSADFLVFPHEILMRVSVFITDHFAAGNPGREHAAGHDTAPAPTLEAVGEVI